MLYAMGGRSTSPSATEEFAEKGTSESKEPYLMTAPPAKDTTTNLAKNSRSGVSGCSLFCDSSF